MKTENKGVTHKMPSQNYNIAYQVREYMLNDKETNMALRGQSNADIKLFVRNDNLQKFSYDEFSYSMLEEDDEDYCEIPEDVYKRMCLLIHSHLSESKMVYNHRTISISWEYDAKNDKLKNFLFGTIKEKHFSRI